MTAFHTFFDISKAVKLLFGKQYCRNNVAMFVWTKTVQRHADVVQMQSKQLLVSVVEAPVELLGGVPVRVRRLKL